MLGGKSFFPKNIAPGPGGEECMYIHTYSTSFYKKKKKKNEERKKGGGAKKFIIIRLELPDRVGWDFFLFFKKNT